MTAFSEPTGIHCVFYSVVKIRFSGCKLKFDDMNVSVNPKLAIGQTFSPDKSHIFDITFDKTEEDKTGNIVVVTAKIQEVAERFSPFIDNEGETFTRTRWFYSFTSYFAMGSLSLVPPIHVEGTIESKDDLGLEVGKNYLVSLKQKESNAL